MIHKKVSFHFPKRSSDFAPIFAPRADHRFAKVGPADYPFPGGGSNLLKSCRPPYLCLVPPGEIFSFFVFFGYFLHAHAPPPPRAHARAPRRGSPVAVCVAREGRAAHARDAEGGADAGTPDADGRGTRAHHNVLTPPSPNDDCGACLAAHLPQRWNWLVQSEDAAKCCVWGFSGAV